jgi:hypothetical protein
MCILQYQGEIMLLFWREVERVGRTCLIGRKGLEAISCECYAVSANHAEPRWVHHLFRLTSDLHVPGT